MILPKISSKAPENLKKGEIKAQTEKLLQKMEELQRCMYAQSKFSLLVVFQGMDASGKDGATRKVFKRISPAGIRVHSFKKPTPLEFSHDFLWRVHQVAPAKGMIQIFNRSHYEDVLIQRVHQWIDMEKVHERYDQINQFENLLKATGTTVLKFYLHVSQEEQVVRLQERKDMPHKFWKHNPGDWEERKRWSDYMEAYEDVFKHCGPETPWTIVPTDKNWYKEYLIAKTVVEALEKMDLSFPPLKED